MSCSLEQTRAALCSILHARIGSCDREGGAIELIVGNPALLVIDMQNDYVERDGALYTPGVENIVSRVVAVINAARAASVPVIFTREARRASGIDWGLEREPGAAATISGAATDAPIPPNAIEGTRGIEIIDALPVLPDDPIVDKRRYSCFLGTELDLLLRELDVQTLLIVGMTTECCVLWTVGDAHQRDYRVRVLEDCVAGSAPDPHEWALRLIRRLTTGGQLSVTAATVARALRERRALAPA